jgi:hypothetical protein
LEGWLLYSLEIVLACNNNTTTLANTHPSHIPQCHRNTSIQGVVVEYC